MTAFKTAYNQTLSHEGSYSNDPRDNGGETYCGISRKNNPQWEGWALVDEVKGQLKTKSKARIAKALQSEVGLTAMVEGFFKANYWDVLLLDEIGYEAVTSELFDQGVNMGLNTAARHFQYALNLLNRNGKDYQDLKVDGKIGKRTLIAWQAYMQTAEWKTRNEQRNIKTILKVLNALQFDRYRDLCTAHPDQEIYLYGWLNRIEA